MPNDEPTTVPVTRADVAAAAAPQSFSAILASGRLEDLFDAVFDGWSGDYLDGRADILDRLLAVREDFDEVSRLGVSLSIFRMLVTAGEESGDMRLVHLAVEARDMLQYGY